MKIINDNNFKIEDYEESLAYLYELLEKPEVQASEELTSKCKEDIDEIEKILEALSNSESFAINKPKKNKRYRRNVERRKKKKLYEETKYSYPSAVYEHEDGSLRRCYFAQNAKRHYKKISNKKFRKNSNKTLRTFGTLEVPRGNKYRKVFDYWWEIY